MIFSDKSLWLFSLKPTLAGPTWDGGSSCPSDNCNPGGARAPGCQIRLVYAQKSCITCANIMKEKLDFAKLHVLSNFLPQPANPLTQIYPFYPWHFATLHFGDLEVKAAPGEFCPRPIKRSAIAPMFLLSFSRKNWTCRGNAQLQPHHAGVKVKRKQNITLACVPLRM